ncbi:MAG TPA: hypothetical protein VF133_11465 [Terriglobales bacterium]
MNHSGNEHFILLQVVNDAVAVREQLANILVIELGYLSPGAREARQYFCSADYGP